MGTDDTRDKLSRNEVHSLLAEPRRRVLVRRLAARDGPASVPELARSLAELSDLTAGERILAVELRHTTLPQLDDADVVDVVDAGGEGADADERVSLTPTGDWLERVRRRTGTVIEEEPL